MHELVRLYESGMTCADIAAELGIPTTTVWYRLKKAGVVMKSSGSRMKGQVNEQSRKFDWLEAKALYEAGVTTVEIARRFGVNGTSGCAALKKMGVTMRSTGNTLSLAAIGNKSVSGHGYVTVRTGKKTKQYEHVLIAERALGRPLRRGEVVHHINCMRTDNRPENLLVCSISYHLALHARMRRNPYWRQVEADAKSNTRKEAP